MKRRTNKKQIRYEISDKKIHTPVIMPTLFTKSFAPVDKAECFNDDLVLACSYGKNNSIREFVSITVYDKESMEEKWSYEAEASSFVRLGKLYAQNTGFNEDMYFMAVDSKVIMFNAQNGNVLYTYTLDGNILYSYYSANGIIYAITDNSTETALWVEPDAFSEQNYNGKHNYI